MAALGLVPLRLEPLGTWDPAEEYWGEDVDVIEDWAQVIIDRGPRPEFEMEQVLPGTDPDDPDSDPITTAIDLRDAGDPAGARRMLMELLDADLRCLDATGRSCGPSRATGSASGAWSDGTRPRPCSTGWCG